MTVSHRKTKKTKIKFLRIAFFCIELHCYAILLVLEKSNADPTWCKMSESDEFPMKTSSAADELTPLSSISNVQPTPLQESSSGDDAVGASTNNSSTLTMAVGVFVIAAVVTKILSKIVVVLLLIVTAIYLRLTIPPKESFDAQKEMKRVKRGKHLPNDHPDKPKTWLEKKFRNVQTAVSAGLTSAVSGYDVKFIPFGIGTLAVVHDLTTGEAYCWAGVLGDWRFELGQKLRFVLTKMDSSFQEARSHCARDDGSNRKVLIV